MTKESLRKLLNKYGFYSFKKEPFLYVYKEEIGFIYTFKDPFYGSLTRKYIPENEESAESFLKKYSWFKRYGKKNQIEIVLDNYETETPEITYQRDGVKLTLEDLKNMEKKPKKNQKQEEEKEIKFQKKLKRSIYILLKVIEEKIKIQNVTYENLVNVTNEYIEKQNELRELMDAYNKKSSRRLSKIEIEKHPDNFEADLEILKKNIENQNEKKALEETTYSLIEYLRNIEMEEGLLKNKYELIKLPLQIEITKEKIKEVQEIKEKKKKVFSKKENLEDILKKIEEKSNLKNIVTFEHYKENEEKRLQEKYAIIEDLDIRTIGDYFLEFDNIKIEEPVIKDQKQITIQETTFEEVISTLEKSFYIRPKKEQDLLTEISFLLKNVWDEKEEQFEKNIEDFITVLKNPNNIMMKVKYFKTLDVSTVTKCKESIRKEIEKLKMLKEEVLIGDCNVFWKGPKKMDLKTVLKVSPKRNLAPVEKESQMTYIGKLKKGSFIWFLPQEINFDMEEVLILEQSKPFFFVNLEKNIVRKENSAILSVGEYKEELKEEKNITIAINLKKKTPTLYQKIIIEGKEL